MHRLCYAAMLFVPVLAAAYSEREIWERDGWDISPTIVAACSADSLWGECAAHAEARFLADSRYARRDSSGLAITLTTGRVLRFDDRENVSDGSGIMYRYLGVVDPLPYHVLIEAWSEAHTYWVVHSTSGWKMRIEAFPSVSPDGRRVAAARIDEFQAIENRLAIWVADSDTLRLEAALDMHVIRHPDHLVISWALARPRWTSPYQIDASILAMTDPRAGWSWRDARAVFTCREGAWVFDGERK